MANYNEILGHESIIEYMKGAVRTGQISHAYLFSGPDKSGKRMLANAFAKALQCEEKGEVPCGKCRSCLQAEHFNHPDIIYVLHEKPNTIRVNEIREQVVNKAAETPYSGPWKIFIIDEAEKMNENAQNALLKTLEEPPSFVVFMLLTENEEMLLETIRSRSMTLTLRPVPAAEIVSWLKEKWNVSEEAAVLSAAFSDGAVGKAVALASSEDFQELRNLVLRLVKNVRDWTVTELIGAVREINDYKLTIADFFDLLMVWFRDVLLYKATREIDELIFRDEVHEIRRQADISSYQGIQEILKGIETAKRRLMVNVSFDLTMELLLMTIKEN